MKRTGLVLAAVLLLGLWCSPAEAQTYSTAALSTTPALDGFGGAVAIEGQQVFISQSRDTYSPGVVYVFEEDEAGAWNLAGELTSDDGFDNDQFGRALAVDQDRMLIGSTRGDGTQGVVYVFEREGDAWQQVAQLMPEDAADDESFGRALAVAGDVALVGAPTRDSTGTAYVFTRDEAGTWTQSGRLVGSGAEATSLFGASVAIAGDELLVGAPQQSEQEGAVYLYAYDDDAEQWTEQRLLVGSTVDGQSHFGHAIAAKGDRALISAPRMDGGIGQVFTFERGTESDAWREAGRLVPFDGRSNYRFGSAVDFNGTEAWIGAPGAARAAGRVYAFAYDQDTGEWSGATKYGGSVASSRDFMAASLAVDASVAAVGLAGADFGEGRTAIYTKDAETGTWQLANTVIGEDRGLEAVVGDKLDCADGKAGRFDCEQTDLISFLPINDLGGDRGTRINDVWGWTDTETGTEWVLLGRSDGTAFVDISNPENPFFAGDLPMTEGSRENVWRDMKVYKNHVYIVADNAGDHGMQVFDLTQLRDVSRDEAPVTFTETTHYDKINSAHNIVINEESGYAYIVGAGGGGETCGGGLHMIDVRTPAEPTFAGCFADPSTGRAGTGYSHDAQCINYAGPDEEHQGKEICFGSNETALSIADVTDKENPMPLAVAEYPNVAYTHQGWITDDHRYFYVNDEIDEISGKVPETRTLIWDVTDLDDPQLIKEYSWGTTASDHNLYIDGNLMYMSNYASGLRIHDITDPENPVEVAHFDTSPGGSNGPGFTGTWSNYPYFESGVIPVSSINEGLFLIKKREANL